MYRPILCLALCCVAHSLNVLQYVEQHVEESVEDTSTACSHEQYADTAVMAWPGSSCSSDDPSFFSLPNPYLLSCPPTKINTKCFPIWEESSDSSAVHWEELNGALHPAEQQTTSQVELRRRRRSIPLSTDYSAPTTSTTGYEARSVNVKWPDRMMHAIFYIDAGCQDIDDTHAEGVWHVERRGTRREQCVELGEGQWASIEFMRQDEWEVFERRRKGLDDGVGKWGWRGWL